MAQTTMDNWPTVQPVKIRLTRWGWAYRRDSTSTVYINQALKEDPALYAEVMAHELGHPPGPWTLHDLRHDLALASPQKLRFILTHPRTWTGFLPIWIEDGRLVYDPSSLLLWLLILVWTTALVR